MQGRVDLEVPFAEKDEAKSLGARWDPASKVWFVPAGLNPNAFQRWLPDGEDGGVTELLPPVYAVEPKTPCWRCDKEPRVATVAADSFITRDESEKSVEPDLYLFSGIEYLPQELLEAMRRVNPVYRRRFSKTAGASYYMNHCICGAQLGDFYMHSEPGGAFFPTTPQAARAIRLRRLKVQGPLAITGRPSMVHPNLVLEYGERVES
jgi:hypothetical protein